MSHVIRLNRNVHGEIPAYVNYRLYCKRCDVMIRHVPFNVNVSADLELSIVDTVLSPVEASLSSDTSLSKATSSSLQLVSKTQHNTHMVSSIHGGE